MTIGDKLHAVMDHLTPGHKTATTETTDGARTTTATHQAHTTQTTNSASAYGATDRAGAGNPASAGAVGGGLAAGATGTNTHSEGVAVAPGNTTAPVPTGEKKFTVIEDHAQEKERVERWVEHQPVQREYVTKVEETGHTQAHPKYTEGAHGTERIVGQQTSYPVNTTTVTGVAGTPTGADGTRLH